MTADALPPCESCVNNLHRVGDGRQPRPEPTDLCRNALGVFSMLDCPLTIGLACSYYEPAETPHPVTSDVDLEAARETMHGDYLGWRYRRRVRWLTKPKTVVPAGILIEGAIEVEEVVPETLAMRELPPAAADAAAPPAADGSVTAPVDPSAPPPPAAPERYPGQRRSEERLAKKRARLAALDAAKAAKEAQIAALSPKAPSVEGGEFDEDEDDGDESGDDEFGGDLVESEPEPVDTGPRTVEQVLAGLPDAPMVGANEQRRRGPGGPGGQGGPREGGGGQPRHRRRRGRRGGGAGGGGPGAGGGGGGPGRGPRPGGPRPGGPRGGGGSRGGGPRPEGPPPGR